MTVKVYVEAVRLLISHETACKGLSMLAQAVAMLVEAIGVLREAVRILLESVWGLIGAVQVQVRLL
jgi:hypothetical protein